ncbi:MAG: hypothetical protein ACO395_06815 [Pontimonas sp.]
MNPQKHITYINYDMVEDWPERSRTHEQLMELGEFVLNHQPQLHDWIIRLMNDAGVLEDTGLDVFLMKMATLSVECMATYIEEEGNGR